MKLSLEPDECGGVADAQMNWDADDQFDEQTHIATQESIEEHQVAAARSFPHHQDFHTVQITCSGWCFTTAFLQHIDNAIEIADPFLLMVVMLENLARQRENTSKW